MLTAKECARQCAAKRKPKAKARAKAKPKRATKPKTQAEKLRKLDKYGEPPHVYEFEGRKVFFDADSHRTIPVEAAKKPGPGLFSKVKSWASNLKMPKWPTIKDNEWYVPLYNYEQGNPDRRIKGGNGPFATKAEADAMYEKEKDVWYPLVRKGSQLNHHERRFFLESDG